MASRNTIQACTRAWPSRPRASLSCRAMNQPSARLWFGRTTHTRMTPFRRSFTHRIAMLEIDIDRLDEADRLSHLFSVDSGNVISFRTADHGARSAAVPLRAWAEGRYAEGGIALDGGAIR